MKAGINYVMIKSPRGREELLSGIYKNRDGSLFISDITHNKPNQSGAHKSQYGTVMDAGKLWYDKEDTNSMPWKTENEVQEGDLAIYYFNDDAWNKGRYHEDGNDIYFFVKYENIYLVIRDGKIIPVNGYVLVEPVYAPQSKLTDYIREVSRTYGIVRHIGKPLEEIRVTEFDDEVPRMNGKEFTGYGLKEGDFVFYPAWCAKPILYSAQDFIGGYYAMRRFGMWCVIEDVSRVILKENYKEIKHENKAGMTDAEFEQAQADWNKQKESEKKAKTLYY